MLKTVPYREGMRLGHSINGRTLSTTETTELVVSKAEPAKALVNELCCNFSLIENVEDVCNILLVPVEYALKVQAGVVQDEAVASCLHDLENESSFTIVFRLTFIKQKEYYDVLDHHIKKIDSDETNQNVSSSPFTHWVKSIDIGNEKIYSITISSTDLTWKDIRDDFPDCLQGKYGDLDEENLEKLSTYFAGWTRAKSRREKIQFSIKTFYYEALANNSDNKFSRHSQYLPHRRTCPEDGLVEVNEKKSPDSFTSLIHTMEIFIAKCKDSKTKIVNIQKHKLIYMEFFSQNTQAGVQPDPMNASSAVQEKIDKYFYTLRAVLQPLPFENQSRKSDLYRTIRRRSNAYGATPSRRMQDYAFTSNASISKLYSLLTEHTKALNFYKTVDTEVSEIQSPARRNEFETIMSDIRESHEKLLQFIENMDLDSSDADSDVRELILFVERNPLQRLHTFMEDLTTKLPAGNPVQLLLFGKTGHGKSSSGNSILLEKVFQSSNSTQSMTQHAMLNYKLIDNRLINVIDTQGVFDTGLDIQDRSNLDLAVRSVSEGINLCRDGFHALVLVLTIDSRFTNEEKLIFELIRYVLGKDVIKLHGILLFTRGDARMDNVPFSEWLKMKHDSAFEQLLQECNYRCVLFDNKTKDPKKMKLQLIKLINLVDSLNGTVYLNDIFDAAENCRLECVHKNPLLNKVYVNALRTIECAAKFITQEKDNAKNRQDQLLLDLSAEIKKFSSNVKKAPSETLKKIVVSLASVRAMVKKYMRGSQFATLDVEEFEPCYKLIVQSEEHCVALLRDDNFETLKSIARLLEELLKGNRELSEGCKNMLHQTRVALNEFFTIFPTTKSKELQVLLKSFSNFNEQVNEVLSTGRLLLLKTQACLEVERIIDRFKNAEQEMDAKVLPYVIAAVNEKKCFPGNALVLLDTGKLKMLKDLLVGERVLARDGTGRLVFDEVYMFGHRQSSVYGLFTKIHTENHAVSVTENHFVFVVNECGERCVPARDVKVGDFLYVSSGEFLKMSRVTNITHGYEEGLYAPFTKTGTVVVDGVLTSCYIDVLPHDTCHRLLWPVRQLYRVSPAALDTINGASQSTCVPWWASAAAKFLK